MLLIDKPTGITSHDVVNRVRRVTGVKRVGHAGTLDPLATGLLIILVGRDETKQQDHFMHQQKKYECTAELGFTSDTYDRDGKMVQQASWKQVNVLSDNQLRVATSQFLGTLHQRVPAYSAVKIKGQKLYEKARRGEIDFSELPVREVTIESCKITAIHRDPQNQHLTADFTIACSPGTYIRSLIHDWGQALGVGATVMELRRTQIGDFSVKDALTLEKLADLKQQSQ